MSHQADDGREYVAISDNTCHITFFKCDLVRMNSSFFFKNTYDHNLTAKLSRINRLFQYWSYTSYFECNGYTAICTIVDFFYDIILFRVDHDPTKLCRFLFTFFR
ncbi:hypothetical protein D3C78_906710 [compost metagenome]